MAIETDTKNPDGKKVLHVKVARVSATRHQDPVAEAMKAIDEDEEPEESYGLTLETEERVGEIFDDRNLELIRTVAREDVESIRDLARRVDRDVRQVHDRVTELEKLGLIELEEEGRRKKPTVWYDSISVDIPVTA
ncbi:MAG: winged helix-turn-helix transcriptional regulator [Halobacteria archaeon]|nr:winged helix-turn-helix transcriptional regulator [Halobacteria archaeon]